MKAFCKDTDKRNQGFCTVVGKQLIDIIKDAKLFMIGAGAIGC